MKYLLIIWELPQSILAFFIWIYHYANIIRCDNFKLSKIIWLNRNDNFGISLGRFIFLSKKYEKNEFIQLHEYGHTIQSKILGFLYLFIVGITSLIRSRINISLYNYYNGYPEKWANNLVKIKYEKQGWCKI